MIVSRLPIAYASPFVPPEWIAAHGCTPVRVVPRAAREAQFDGQGVCYYCHSLAEELCKEAGASGIVLTTTCDQMRRMTERVALEIPQPVFLLNVPATWQSESSRALYRAELQRLGDFLVELGGQHPSQSELAALVSMYGEQRAASKSAGPEQEPRVTNGIPLALLGGPALREHEGILTCIRQAGGHVALDGRTGAERTRPKPLNRDLVQHDPISALVDAYFDYIPDAFRRPNNRLFDWLDSAVSARALRGIIVGHYVWCDLWRAEAFRLKERAGVPCLVIEYDESPEISERTTSRIHAFLETLQ